jgi:hypothetical protein
MGATNKATPNGNGIPAIVLRRGQIADEILGGLRQRVGDAWREFTEGEQAQLAALADDAAGLAITGMSLPDTAENRAALAAERQLIESTFLNLAVATRERVERAFWDSALAVAGRAVAVLVAAAV